VLRPFRPQDALRLRSQQTTGTCFEIETTVLLGRSPLHDALVGCWPLGQRSLYTLVLNAAETGAPEGFVQLRPHRAAPEADLVFIAPDLAGAQRAALAWHRLISDACQWLGARGIQRVHVAVNEDDQLGLQIFRQLGFTVTTNDIVFRRPADRPLHTEVQAPTPTLRTVPYTSVHQLAVDGLVYRCLPDTVRQAGETTVGDWRNYPLGGHVPSAEPGWVWLDGADRVLGAWYMVRGRDGCWLRAVADPQADATALVQHALAAAGATGQPPLPIYTAARGYEPGLNLALRAGGFVPLTGRFRLVKTMTVQVREPTWRAAGAKERAAQAIPTHSVEPAAAVPPNGHLMRRRETDPAPPGNP
jgi:hypothetical protein